MSLSVQVARTIEIVEASQWNACARGLPYLQHGFLRALERSGTAVARRGIRPLYVLLRDPKGVLLGCAPAMLKTGTLAEYGPEHLWLAQGIAEGCFRWPKLQVGVPLYPIRGPKLLARPDAPEEKVHAVLLEALKRLAIRAGSATLNLMQLEPAQAAALAQAGWTVSHETHGFWRNADYVSYEAYLQTLPHKKRYRVRKEGARFAALGLTVRFLHGEEITPGLLERYYAGHIAVCRQHGNRPWLPIAMLEKLVAGMPEAVRMIAAFDGKTYVAGIFCLVDDETLYLRTWSSLRDVPELALELVCNRPIELAIDNGFTRIDSGLSAQHKLTRGYAEEPVWSAHWFFNARLARLAQGVLAQQNEAAPVIAERVAVLRAEPRPQDTTRASHS